MIRITGFDDKLYIAIKNHLFLGKLIIVMKLTIMFACYQWKAIILMKIYHYYEKLSQWKKNQQFDKIHLDESSSVDENPSFWRIFTDLEINRGYKNLYLMKTINCYGSS